jgi:hypothetical protein
LYNKRDAIRNRNDVLKGSLAMYKASRLEIGYISFLYETYVSYQVILLTLSISINDKIIIYGCLHMHAYKQAPEFWYWEVIETFRRLTLTGILTLIYPGSSQQIVIAIALCGLSLLIYTVASPYESQDVLISATLCQLSVLVVLFVGK